METYPPGHVIDGFVTLPSGGSYKFVFHTNYNFQHIHTIQENTYYGQDVMVMPVHQYSSSTYININTLGNAEYTRLRIHGNTGGNPVPIMVRVKCTSQHGNTNQVKIEFAQNSGYVSSAVLIIGRNQQVESVISQKYYIT